ncbi:hypothetical protein DFP74_5324 [Nocardiopsis sp. Huas11]|uniref:SRPBCC family protein n=1 Tax=Nocardiopsis sp. Huas11 TaxID=2183912 RepID=UPI000EB2D2CA|nr:SRPBCC family protein [Nocardiopsis sp. Huas11]RKS09582.1 hypothetical protein DFP74_5324 [Nocardiopsis sp. Huas11]
MPVYNTHERRLDASPEEVGALIDTLASDDDRLWAHGTWPPMFMDGPLAVGAAGGHGPVRYSVEQYVPGHWVRLRFSGPRGFDGFHEFTVRPDPSGGTVLAHLLAMRAHGPARLSWPLVFGPLHDALLEDSLDRAELTFHGSVRAPARWSPWVRLLRSALARTAPASRRQTVG